MRAEQISDALNELENDIVEEAMAMRRERRRGKRNQMKWGAAAACLCLVVAGILVLPRPAEENRWPVKEVQSTASSGGESVAVVPRWEELSISQQYAAAEFDGKEYSSQNTVVPEEQTGALLGRAELSGWDVYTDRTYRMEAAVYELSGISTDCAVAVRFDGREGYYVYVNHLYQPATLGQFIDDLNLEENLSLGSAWYSWKKPTGEYAMVEFSDFEDQTAWDMLLANREITSVENFDGLMLAAAMSISVDIPLLGYENIGLWVTEDGYLATNILAAGKAFFIGPDRVRAFIDYVTEHCQGYELVYVPGEENTPE